MKEVDLIQRYQEVKDYYEGVESPFFGRLEEFVKNHAEEVWDELTGSDSKQNEHDLIMGIRAMKRLLAHARTQAASLTRVEAQLEAADIKFDKLKT